ncbi:MAG: right-handed parallel beta-helix repeat-containing protein [Dysgonamonadaceae bacterium]|nr:right-handed parallel beta-helix repeat-containing protein [Dysgonamonadaceae bacterium]
MNKVIKNNKYLALFCALMIPLLTFGQGSRYTGTYKKSDPITLKNEKDIIIEGLEISDIEGRAITLFSCQNIIIRNCKFKNINTAAALYAEKGANILITDCFFENVHRGFIAGNCTGNIKFEHNDVKNILGNLRGGSVFSQAVQFNGCNGEGNSISYNCIENIPGESSPEDNIALYKSNGTPKSPIMIKANWIRGGGPSGSGGGINLGDWGGSYQIAEDNILVNPGQVGMGMAGGHDMTFKNNKIYAKRQPFTNVGLVIHNWTPDKTGKSYNITIDNNQINWTNSDGNYNTAWVSNSMREIVKDWYNQGLRNPNITEKILPEVIIQRFRKTEDESHPDVEKPDNTTPESPITDIYTDRFNRISIKCLVSPIPLATANIYTSSGQRIASRNLSRFRTLIDHVLNPGEYNVEVSYGSPVITETKKITIK